MTYEEIENLAQEVGLQILGVVDEDRQIILLGPSSGFWEFFSNAPENKDGHADPVDRWSKRVIRGLAELLGCEAEFPFGGPPYAPFMSWAIASGRAWSSRVGMLVHDQMGLMVSYRGALVLKEPISHPEPAQDSPCQSCIEQPCLTACPVGALGAEGYNTDRCAAHLRTDAGADCMNGCLVRRSCPYSLGAERKEAQSRLHMQAFLGNR